MLRVWSVWREYPKDVFPLAEFSPELLINPFFGHGADPLQLLCRSGPAVVISFLSLWMLSSVCMAASCPSLSFQKVKCFLISLSANPPCLLFGCSPEASVEFSGVSPAVSLSLLPLVFLRFTRGMSVFGRKKVDLVFTSLSLPFLTFIIVLLFAPWHTPLSFRPFRHI